MAKIGLTDASLGMQHLLEPDRPGFVPSVSFLRPVEELRLGVLDSAAWPEGSGRLSLESVSFYLAGLKGHHEEQKHHLGVSTREKTHPNVRPGGVVFLFFFFFWGGGWAITRKYPFLGGFKGK